MNVNGNNGQRIDETQATANPICGFAVLKIEGGYAIGPLPNIPIPSPLEQLAMMEVMKIELQTQYQVRQTQRMQTRITPAAQMPPNLRVLEKM